MKIATALTRVLMITSAWSSTQSATVQFKNQCNYSINVFDNNSLCTLDAGSRQSPLFGCDRTMPSPVMYRHNEDPQATLAEFSYGSGKAWYDISIIPPGPRDCNSLENCHQLTNKTGFNVPVMILPTKFLDSPSHRCERIMCQYDGCPDAYQFPSDNSKVYNCPDDEHFQVIYCP